MLKKTEILQLHLTEKLFVWLPLYSLYYTNLCMPTIFMYKSPQFHLKCVLLSLRRTNRINRHFEFISISCFFSCLNFSFFFNLITHCIHTVTAEWHLIVHFSFEWNIDIGMVGVVIMFFFYVALICVASAVNKISLVHAHDAVQHYLLNSFKWTRWYSVYFVDEIRKTTTKIIIVFDFNMRIVLHCRHTRNLY